MSYRFWQYANIPGWIFWVQAPDSFPDGSKPCCRIREEDLRKAIADK